MTASSKTDKVDIMRGVALPEAIAGQLWLGPMPGRLHPLEEALAAYRARGVDRIVCLTPMSEIAEKSPAYAAHLKDAFPFPVMAMPSTDFGIPADEARFAEAVSDAAAALRNGQALFVHCAAGIGRTGTFAACVLAALGFDEEAALERVRAAGSGPETDEQAQLVRRIAGIVAQPLGGSAAGICM